MSKPCLILHLPAGHPTTVHVLSLPVSDSITRMTDLCRALGILDGWRVAASLDAEALVRVNAMRLGLSRIDLAAQTVNDVKIVGADETVIAEELSNLSKITTGCAVKDVLAFVAVTMPVWLPRHPDDLFVPEPLDETADG
jgi:hypothetical protein